MDRCAVLVDAGYFLAQAATALGSKNPSPRRDALLDTSACAQALRDLSSKLSGLPLLRIYWYDGANHKGPTAEHAALAAEQEIKLRLGAVRADGRQKGVDPLLVADLIELSKNRAFTDVVLITGDADITPGIEKAQSYGIRAHLVCSAPIERSVSPLLRETVDTVTELGEPFFKTFCQLRVKHDDAEYGHGFLPGHDDDWEDADEYEEDHARYAGGDSEDTLRVAARLHWESVDAARQKHLAAAIRSGAGVPPEHDGRLLARARAGLGRELNGNERRILREALRSVALADD